jgi:hypothetical protein
VSEKTCCQGAVADLQRMMSHLAEAAEQHADRDGLTGVRRAVFLARGGHEPGDTCPTEPVVEPDPHAYWCADPDEPCSCGVAD